MAAFNTRESVGNPSIIKDVNIGHEMFLVVGRESKAANRLVI